MGRILSATPCLRGQSKYYLQSVTVRLVVSDRQVIYSTADHGPVTDTQAPSLALTQITKRTPGPRVIITFNSAGGQRGNTYGCRS